MELYNLQLCFSLSSFRLQFKFRVQCDQTMFGCLGLAKYDIPNETEDDPGTFQAKKQRVIGRLTPLSLAHPATANTLIALGSKARYEPKKYGGRSGTEVTCSFPLPVYLIWAGTAALSLFVLGVINKYMVWWIVKTGKRKGDGFLLKTLETISIVTALLEVGCVIVMTFLLFPKWLYYQSKNPNEDYYCDYDLLLFSTIFFLTMWFVVLFGAMGFIYLQYVRVFKKATRQQTDYFQYLPEINWPNLE